MFRCLGEIENSALGGDGSDEALARSQASDVNRFLAQAMRCEQLETIVAEEIDRADVASHRFGDEVDDAVKLALRRAAFRHDLVKSSQDLTGGRGGGASHDPALSDAPPPCHAKRLGEVRDVAAVGRVRWPIRPAFLLSELNFLRQVGARSFLSDRDHRDRRRLH